MPVKRDELRAFLLNSGEMVLRETSENCTERESFNERHGEAWKVELLSEFQD